MSLVAPMFLLAGALLAAIPVVIHFLNRRRFKEQRWAAMDFLMRAMKQNRKRLKFEQWLLLVVRCLLLGLLGLALARPVGCAGDGGALGGVGREAGLTVIVLDESYSMGYDGGGGGGSDETHLGVGKALAGKVIGGLIGGSDAVEVIVASKPARVVFPAGYDLEAARAAVGRVEQSGLGTDLAGALVLAEKAGRESAVGGGGGMKVLHVISDGTRSSLDGAAGGEQLKQAAVGVSRAGFGKVWFHHLGQNEQRHVAVTEIGARSGLVTARGGQELFARVGAYGAEGGRRVEWRLDDRAVAGGGAEVRLKEGEAVESVLSQVKFGRPGARVVSARVVPGEGDGADRLGADQVRSRVVDVADRVKVLIVEGERGGIGGSGGGAGFGGGLGSSGAFLRLALAPPAGGESAGGVGGESRSAFEAEAVSDLELPGKVLAGYRVVVLAGVGQIADGTAEQLKGFVSAGGVLLVFTGEGVSAESYNATMLPRGLLPGALVKRVSAGADGAGSADGGGVRFDFQPQGNVHPMLSVFKGELRSGLDTAQVFTYWQVGSVKGERVLSFAGTGDPAITTQSLGDGRVVFVATSAGADGWTSLPAKPVFVALVQEMISTSLTTRDGWMNVLVGERLELPGWVKLAGAPGLTDASGRVFVMASEAGADGKSVWRSEVLGRAGVYVLKGVAEAAEGLPIAVNVDAAAEADVRTVDDAGVKRALGDINVEVVRGGALPETAARGDERRADFGWVVMLAVLGLVGFESLMALRFGHYRRS